MGEQEVDSSLPSDPVQDKAFVELMSQAANDSDYQQVYEAVKGHKVPSQLPITHPAQKFQGQWDALSIEATLPHLILYHGQIVVPHEARKEVLKTLHIQHTGESKTLANARQIYFWPGMTSDVKLMAAACKECLGLRPSQQMEPKIQTTASRPFEAVSIDLGYQH